MTNDPMHLAPRCCAHARTTGRPCCAPAMGNGRCRMHGGKSTGPAKGTQNALRHGRRSAAYVADRKAVNELLRASRAMIREFGNV